MASNTPNLNLYKKDPVTDGNDVFNIETMLNENWDKIDKSAAKLGKDGFLPSSILPDDIQKNKLTLSNGTLQRVTVDLNDLNTVTRFVYANAGCTNKPNGFNEGIVEVFRFVDSTNRTYQRATDAVTFKTYTRGGVLGKWEPWQELAKTGQLLPNGTNLDDVNTEGVYFTNSAGNANTMQNTAQANVPFSLCVTVQTARIIQEFTTNDAVPRRFIRTFSLSVWQPWVEVLTSKEDSALFKTRPKIEAGTNLNSVTTPGMYRTGLASDYTSSPEGLNWCVLNVYVSTVGYIVQEMYSVSTNEKAYRTRTDSFVWKPWKKIPTTDAVQMYKLTKDDGKSRMLAGKTDLDTIVDAGFYDGSNLVNAPTTESLWWYIHVYVHNATSNGTEYVLQRANSLNKATGYAGEYIRRRVAGVWTPWVLVENSNQKNVANGYAGLDNKAFVKTENLPYGGVVNLLGDSGRFMDIDGDPKEITVKTEFMNNSFFTPWNGTTVTSGGKFIHDNTTNGGTAGALTEDVISLTTAIGMGGLRYGTEYYIASYTMGTGKANAGNAAGTYLMTVNNNFPAGGVDKQCTVAFWIRVKSGKTVSIARGNRLRKNGVIQTASYITLTPSDGWVHIEKNSSMGNGYGNAEPNISATAGDVVQIAMPVVVAGAIGVGVHVAPVMGASLGFVPLPAKKMGEIANGTLTYAGTTKGTATALTASVASGVITSLVAGDRISFKTHVATSGAVSLNLNGLGAKHIKKPNGNNPNLALGGVYTVIYDGSAFILQGEGGEYGQVTADKVLSGVTFGTENGLSTGTMPNNANGKTSSLFGPYGSGGLSVGVPYGAYLDDTGFSGRSPFINISSSDFKAENFRSDKNIFGLQGSMPVKTAYTGVVNTVWNGTDMYVRIPKGAYMDLGSEGYPEVVLNAEQCRADGNIRPENIRAGVWIYGVLGTLEPKQYASGEVWGNADSITVTGLNFRPKIFHLYIPNQYSVYSSNEFLYKDVDGNIFSYGVVTPGGNPQHIATDYRLNDSGFSISSYYSQITVGTYKWQAWG